jgi:hypothetical protein
MIVLGCDPGLTGALCAIDTARGLLACADVPTCDNGLTTGSMKRWVDEPALERLLAAWSQKWEFAREAVHAAIERPIPMPTLPAQTIASQFDTFGVLRTALGRRATVRYVAPQAWKKLYGIGNDKDRARQVAAALYADAPVGRVKDHNRAEAILIAHWLRKEVA